MNKVFLLSFTFVSLVYKSKGARCFTARHTIPMTYVCKSDSKKNVLFNKTCKELYLSSLIRIYICLQKTSLLFTKKSLYICIWSYIEYNGSQS